MTVRRQAVLRALPSALPVLIVRYLSREPEPERFGRQKPRRSRAQVWAERHLSYHQSRFCRPPEQTLAAGALATRRWRLECAAET